MEVEARHNEFLQSATLQSEGKQCNMGSHWLSHEISTYYSFHSGQSTKLLANKYTKEIVWLYRVPARIVSDRDIRFRSHFWESLKKSLGTYLKFNMSYHPETYGQFERMIQILEDMLRAYRIDFKGSWENHLYLTEFSYNNIYQASIKMAPFETLYGRKCRSPLCWDKVGKFGTTSYSSDCG